ncbi:hypothetical protein RchiOBHm_Chr5g0016901 [Rosa chinensis]|uniref:Uncharacterized protein n=1 Tax=Rosa chinensis TaxID=74649 RepID=A0A2P6Q6D6_ROSCH|nr:hypothetical protein RchiOBHm_Chr5g0016901 [Rosa chinensis]
MFKSAFYIPLYIWFLIRLSSNIAVLLLSKLDCWSKINCDNIGCLISAILPHETSKFMTEPVSVKHDELII